MLKAPIPGNESKRLTTLKGLRVLDTEEESPFDQITHLASLACETPIALISFVDENRQWFKSHYGLSIRSTPRDISFCGHALFQNDIFQVRDASLDERFSDNPLVTQEPFIRFYAGVAVVSTSGDPVGTLCVIDTKPRVLSSEQKAVLKLLAAQVVKLLELRTENDQALNLNTKLKVLLSNMSEGMVLQDESGRVIEHNPAALQILGIDPDKLTGRSLMDSHWQITRRDGAAFPKEEHPGNLALSNGIGLRHVIMGIRSPEGVVRWVSMNSTPVFQGVLNRPTHAVTSFVDVTEEINLAKSLEVASFKTMQSAKMASLGEMAGSIAHEINNPLTIIAGHAEYLKRTMTAVNLDRENVSKKLDLITATADRIAKIVKGLKTFSRDAEKDPMQCVGLKVILLDSLELCRDRFRNADVGLKVTNTGDGVIRCRSAQVSQVILNLLNNAFDAVRDLSERWVVVHVTTYDDRLEISITDSGLGIPVHIQEKLMQPYFTTKNVGSGTGLGLSISKNIVEEHGGTLTYDAMSRHTRFNIIFPRVLEPQTKKSA